MRNLVTDFSFTGGTRDITINNFPTFTRHNIRLIVNETQHKIYCSSMQKELCTVNGNVITFDSSLPVLADGDELTIEMDLGGNGTYYTSNMVFSEKPDLMKFFENKDNYNNILLSINDSNLTYISDNTFYNNAKSLQSVVLPNVTYIGSYGFAFCQSLQTVYMPSVANISTYVFDWCISLKECYMPSCKTLMMYTFRYCSELRKVTLGQLTTSRGDACFNSCSKLIDITLGQDTNIALNMTSWNPTEAMLDTSNSLVEEGESFTNNREKLLYNIREHLAANLMDLTGTTAKTITFNSSTSYNPNMKTIINNDAATVAAFTSKNWTIA